MQAIYRNKSGQQIEIRLIAEGDKYYLEPEYGVRIPFTSTLTDGELGLMTLVDDPRRLAVIEEINQLVYRLPELDFDNFMNAEDAFREAFNSDFLGLPLSRILFFEKLLAEAGERAEIKKLDRSCGLPFDNEDDKGSA